MCPPSSLGMRGFKFCVRFFVLERRRYSPCCSFFSFDSSEHSPRCWLSEAKHRAPRNGNLPSGPGRNPLPGFECRGFNVFSFEFSVVFSNANRAYNCAIRDSIHRFGHLASEAFARYPLGSQQRGAHEKKGSKRPKRPICIHGTSQKKREARQAAENNRRRSA